VARAVASTIVEPLQAEEPMAVRMRGEASTLAVAGITGRAASMRPEASTLAAAGITGHAASMRPEAFTRGVVVTGHAASMRPEAFTRGVAGITDAVASMGPEVFTAADAVALMHAEAFTCAVDIRFMAIAVPPKGAADGIGDRLPLMHLAPIRLSLFEGNNAASPRLA